MEQAAVDTDNKTTKKVLKDVYNISHEMTRLPASCVHEEVSLYDLRNANLVLLCITTAENRENCR
jgi:hypothetical protein